MNHKVHSLIIFMANPFSFCLGVFFKREMANPINQEARTHDFVANRPVVANLCRPYNGGACMGRVFLLTSAITHRAIISPDPSHRTSGFI